MSSILSLKWNNHTTTFIHNLDVLRCKELYCDATIACHGKYYPVHRFVLMTCSEYFEEIFTRTPCKHPFIILNDVNQNQIEDLLQYMYKGEVHVLQENLPGLIKAAEALRVKGLAVPEVENTNSKCFRHTILPPITSPVISESEDERVPSHFESPAKEDNEVRKDNNDETNENDYSRSLESLDCQTLEPEIETIEDCSNANIDEAIDSSHKNDTLQEVDEAKPIKTEVLDEQELNEEYKIPHGIIDKTPSSFLSLLNTDREAVDSTDHVNGFSIPQCSSWNDALQNSDAVNKENVGSSWLHASDYDGSFPIDPIHYLSNNTDATSSYSSYDISDPPSAVKDEKPLLMFTNASKNKNHKYPCNECPFSTNDKAAFRLHIMRKHTGEKPYACTLCTYRCTTKDMLKIHTRKHTGEKPFSCPYCTCRMAVKSSLKRHILLKHIQGRKPKSQTNSLTSLSLMNMKTYKCNFCTYESQMKSNLKLHCMRIHTGEKPVACNLCPYRTTTKPQLDKHMRKHTGEKPFPCTFCSYKAAQKHSLLRHMALHTK